MNLDNWHAWKDYERAPARAPSVPPYLPHTGPRLKMEGYKFPAGFDVGRLERVRQLNAELLRVYRDIGKTADELSEATECYNTYKDDFTWDFLAKEKRPKMLATKARLDGLCFLAKALIAELKAIGVKPHIPNQLKDKIVVQNFVPVDGSLAFLPGVNFYYSEVLGDVNVQANHKRLLRRMSYHVNRIMFLKECEGKYTESNYFAAIWKALRRQLMELQESNFGMDPVPRLKERVNEILAQEPARVRAEREEEERRLSEERGEVSDRGQEGALQLGVDVDEVDGEAEGALQLGVDVDEADGEDGEAEGAGQVGVQAADGEVQEGAALFSGVHTRFQYSSDEDVQVGVEAADSEVQEEAVEDILSSEFLGVHTRFYYSSDEEE